jgi:ribosomal protein L11 methyltransferase
MFELRLICTQDTVDTVGDALQALGAQSVSTLDADAGSAAENALFGEPGWPAERDSWSRTLVSALFRGRTAAREASRLLALQGFFRGATVIGIGPVPEQDWVRLTQAQFHPVAITPEFWITPSWHQAPTQARKIIQLDPGQAFGTGAHPTTRMCLRWIAAHPPEHQRVLDYGCGSGILAIAAALWGAGSADAVDIDPVAVATTQGNAVANGVDIRTGTPELADGRYDTVYANILASPLKVLAPLLCGHVGPRGTLVLAGILERQTEELQQAYRPWINLTASDVEEGWVLLTGQSA